MRIYYQLGSFAEKHRAMLLRSAITAVDEDLEFLGESAYEGLLNLFYVESREEIARIVGRPVSGFSNWTASGVFVVLDSEWRSFEKHEITHVFTMTMWGAPDISSRWMIEGVAISSDGWCREYSVDEIAFHLLSHGKFPPLKQFFNDFAKLGEIRGGIYAASVIGFIRHTYGAEALRKLWIDGSGNLTESLGSDVGQIEILWREYLELTVKEDVPIDLETIEDSGCG